MIVVLTYTLGAAAFWAAAAAFMGGERDRRRARLGFLGTVLGGALGWVAFGTVGAMLVAGLIVSATMLGFSLRTPRRREVVWGPIPFVGGDARPSVELKAS